MFAKLRHLSLATCPSTLLVCSLALFGCGGGDAKTKSPEGPKQVTDGPPAPPPGGHPSEGPHHGSLIELGNEDYHAELVHDEKAGTVTIYVLDGAATKQIPIDASEVTINVTHDGKPEQFKLAAQPDETDPPGKSSRFVSSDKDLAHDLDAHGVEARLALKIDGKSYNGKIEHSHAH